MKSRDHLDLIVNIGELNALLSGSGDLKSFLDQVVTMVAKHMHTAVVSIYLYNEADEELVLESTHGLSSDAIGKVRLGLGEGLVGMALKELRPIVEDKASDNPDFKPFPGINEEKYESFLAVPIRRGISRAGVLVAQRDRKHPFSFSDTMALRAIASQLAGTIENGRAFANLNQIGKAEGKSEIPTFIVGRSAAGGSALAESVIIGSDGSNQGKTCDWRHYTAEEFEAAVSRTKERMDELQRRLKDEIPEAASLIFSAHRMMLMDQDFLGAMRTRIEEGENPPVAVQLVTQLYMDLFRQSEHSYMREKAEDVADLGAQLISHLTGLAHRLCADCEGRIVITRELFPSHMLQLHTEGVKGVVLAKGGVTGHVSILARSLDISLIISDDPLVFKIPNGTMVLLDGTSGYIHLNPSESVISSVQDATSHKQEVEALDAPLRPVSSTADGHPVKLLANINLLSEVKLAADIGVEGVGLYRSEFPFLIRNSFPSEEEQVGIYSRLFDAMEGKLVTVRTLDVGGDKVLSYYDDKPEENPELGLRSTRFAMAHEEIFLQQIRAILRAGSDHEKLRIMFPMIGSLCEFRAAKKMVLDAVSILCEEGVEHNDQPEIGMMIEVPSAVEIMEELALEADFFSIGTNDFVQYMLAVDRNNDRVASYYQPHHPAVLRSLHRAISIACRHDRDVSICGEMAHDPLFTRFFLGSGVRTLSTDPHTLHFLQDTIAGINLEEAKDHTAALLRESTIEGVERLL